MGKLHHRKPNRLKGYDYSQQGYYFVTICTHNRIEYFGGIKNDSMVINKYGLIVRQQWKWLENHFKYVHLDEFIIMPNHMHGILEINPNVGTNRDLSLLRQQKHNDEKSTIKIKSLSELIGAFKTTSSKQIHLEGLLEFKWQRSFYEHIVRNEKSLEKIRWYIKNNPLLWKRDRNRDHE